MTLSCSSALRPRRAVAWGRRGTGGTRPGSSEVGLGVQRGPAHTWLPAAAGVG